MQLSIIIVNYNVEYFLEQCLHSIRAALNPAQTDALYFVAKGNGESHFSTNLTDHNKAVNEYQKRQK